MIASLKDAIVRATKDYHNLKFDKWVLAWPGQAVLTAKAINWTAEAMEAIKSKNDVSVII